jgi:hypothetical protein
MRIRRALTRVILAVGAVGSIVAGTAAPIAMQAAPAAHVVAMGTHHYD